MIRLHRDRAQNYYYLLSHENGIAFRWGRDNEEIFWREEGPELLDISITNYCERGCEFCYRRANKNGHFMEFPLYGEIIQQAEKAGVQQIALGGGNPNQHPEFGNFLKKAREHHIMASYTTNGQGMTEEIYQLTKQYGGAVAVSWYSPYDDARKVIEKCGEYGIPVNVHFLLYKDSIANAVALLRSEEIQWKYINAIVVLNYKPMGNRIYEGLKDEEELDIFLKMAMAFKKCKIGFDSCMISWLVKHRELIVEQSIDYCEAGRFSAIISEKGLMYPCSFLAEDKNFGDSVRERGLTEIWKNSRGFNIMRNQLSYPARQKVPISNCASCADYPLCHGGCQVFSINRCG